MTVSPTAVSGAPEPGPDLAHRVAARVLHGTGRADGVRAGRTGAGRAGVGRTRVGRAGVGVVGVGRAGRVGGGGVGGVGRAGVGVVGVGAVGVGSAGRVGGGGVGGVDGAGDGAGVGGVDAVIGPRELERALRAEDAPGGRAGSAARVARATALLHRLVPDPARDPVESLARDLDLVLRAPADDPLWQDLRRLTDLVEGLGQELRSQRRRARLVRSAAAAAEVAGTEQVIARSLASFAETWRPGP